MYSAILPENFYVSSESRRVWAGSCAFIRFYHGAAESFDGQRTASRHSYCVQQYQDPRHRALDKDVAGNVRPRWRVEHAFLTLNFDRFDTLDSYDKLTRAREAIIEDTHILGGTPAITGQ